jgi:hypothetical protein
VQRRKGFWLVVEWKNLAWLGNSRSQERTFNAEIAKDAEVRKDSRLTAEEAASLGCQTRILKTGRGQHQKYLPYAFTEQGVAMLSSVLHSRRAVLVNVEIMGAFVAVRREAGRSGSISIMPPLAERGLQSVAMFEAVGTAVELTSRTNPAVAADCSPRSAPVEV